MALLELQTRHQSRLRQTKLGIVKEVEEQGQVPCSSLVSKSPGW